MVNNQKPDLAFNKTCIADRCKINRFRTPMAIQY